MRKMFFLLFGVYIIFQSCTNSTTQTHVNTAHLETTLITDSIHHSTDFDLFFCKFVTMLNSKDEKNFNQFIDTSMGLFLIKTSGAMPQFEKVMDIAKTSISDKKKIVESIEMEALKKIQNRKFPLVDCDFKNGTPYAENGYFMYPDNDFKKSKIWEFANLKPNVVKEIEAQATLVKMVFLNTKTYKFYFSFTKNSWHLVFIDMRIPCTA